MALTSVNPWTSDCSIETNKVILEYVFVNHTCCELMNKTKVADTEPKCLEDCPLWYANIFKDLEGKDFCEVTLKPAAMFENPFFKSPHKIVFCEIWITKDEPAEINSRFRCNETMNRLKYDAKTGYRPHQAHEPWFGIEQEYCVIDDADKPVSYDPHKYDYKTLAVYSTIGPRHDVNVGVERELSSRHLLACLYAGVTIGGRDREDGPSQWEFQIGPCEGVTIGDHLYVARYILYRLAELYGLRVTFSPIPVPGEAFTSAGHLNFSTSRMRQKGGIEFIRHAIDILSKSSEEPLLGYYDPTKELANSIRLQDTISQYHPRLNEFVFDAANKKLTSVRIPQFVQDNGYGYFEDRRPSSELDPYSAADGLVRACIFGDFLKPEYQHLKDLRFWDKE